MKIKGKVNYKEVLKGDIGYTFTPHLTNDGILYWTNNGNLPNPIPVNISGQGYTFTPHVDELGNLSWTNDGNLDNPPSFNIKGDKGYFYTPHISDDGILSWTNNGNLENPKPFNINDLMLKEVKDARTATTGEKFNSLDERIDAEIDRLNNKIEISMLQQVEKESHIIENSVDGMTTEMIIGGRTLQNLWKPISINWDSTNKCFNALASSIDFSITEKVITVKNITDKSINFQFSKLDNSYDSQVVISSGETKVINVTSLQKFRGVIGLESVGWENTTENKNKLINGLIVCIGEYSYLPNVYFEGIKSLGQQENKISILSHGKNLININDIKTDANTNVKALIEGDKLIITSNNDTPWRNAWIEYTLKGGIDYCFKYNANGNGFIKVNIRDFYNDNISYTNDINVGQYKTFRVSKDTKVRIRFFICGSTQGSYRNEYYNIQLEHETHPTTYQSYRTNKKDILLSEYGIDEGLNGINTSVYDELNSIKNKAIKRIGKYVFTGDENIEREQVENIYTRFIINVPNVKISTGRLPIIHTKVSYSNDGHNSFIGFICEGNFYFYINSIDTDTLEIAREFIRGTTLYYELNEPIEIDLNTEINMKVYQGKTYVEFLNSINGTSSFKAPINTQATLIDLINKQNKLIIQNNKISSLLLKLSEGEVLI